MMRCGARARARARDRALVRGLALDPALARLLARSIDLDRDRDLARIGLRALDRSVVVRGGAKTVAVARAMPGRASRRMVGVTGATLGGLPLLLITTLALVAVYSPDPVRRAAAEKILDRLLTTLRPQDTSTRNPPGQPRPAVLAEEHT